MDSILYLQPQVTMFFELLQGFSGLVHQFQLSCPSSRTVRQANRVLEYEALRSPPHRGISCDSAPTGNSGIITLPGNFWVPIEIEFFFVVTLGFLCCVPKLALLSRIKQTIHPFGSQR